MRVVFINPIKGDDWGGMENWMLRLCTGLRKLGDDCAVVGRPNSSWPEVCREHDLRFYPFFFGMDLLPTAVCRLAAHMRDAAPDVICAKGFRQVRFARIATAQAAVAVKLPNPRDLTDSWVDRITYTLCVDRVIVDSHAARHEFLKHPWALRGKIAVVHNGLEAGCNYPNLEGRAKMRALLGVPEKALLIAATGRFTAGKRYADALEAFARSGRAREALFVLIGDGPERSALEQKARDLGIAENVRFAGWRDDAQQLIHAADFFLHPSESEGFPNVVLEAMVAGVVPVATRAGGTPEMMQHGTEGFLVNIGDIAGMALFLEKLAVHADVRAKMSAAAAWRARTEFTADAMVRTARQVFAEAAMLKKMARPPIRRGPDGWKWVCRSGDSNDFELLNLPWDNTVKRVKDEDKTRVVRAELGGRVLYAKVYAPTSLFDRIRTGARPPRSLANFRTAHQLGLSGVETVPHVAAGWRRRAGLVSESVLVTEKPYGSVPVNETAIERQCDPAWRKSFTVLLAEWLAGLHASRIVPHDLKASNILYLPAALPEESSLILLDLDNCRVHGRASRPKVARNFHQFYRSFEKVVSRREILRFAAVYRIARRLTREEIRAVLQATGQRLAKADAKRR